MQVDKVVLNPLVLFIPVDVGLPSQGIDHFQVCLNSLYNLELTVVDPDTTIWEPHSQQTLNLTGKERQRYRNTIALYLLI